MILALISGSALVNVFVVLVVAGLICWLLWWFLGFAGVPEPFNKILRVIIALIAVLICINALLGITGNGYRW